MSADKDKSDKAAAASSNGNPSERQAKPECFVIMPISDPDGYEPGHFRHVYEDLFTPACDDAGYRAVRADEVRQTNLIHLDVLQKIIESPMALCDLSSRNPNVLFELGLRQAFDKPVVLVQEVGTLQIFDINPLRYASYRREMLYRQVIEDQREIGAAIKETKAAIGDNKSINSIVKLLSLTHPASLRSISDSDKESALLQVIMHELGNLRSEFKSALNNKRQGTPQTSVQKSIFDSGRQSPSSAADVPLYIDYLTRHGLVKFISELGVGKGYITRALKHAENVVDFLDGILAYPQLSSVIEHEVRALTLLPISFMEAEFEKAKKES